MVNQIKRIMKELSIEEKAKAYDNVRKKIATRFGSNVAKEIFSYYEESEDERIRKELLNAFQESEDSLYMVLTPHKRESFIAWLEKQKETFIIKPYEWDNEKKCSYPSCVISKQESEDEKIKKKIISAIKEDWPGHTDWIAWLEKQGEQKPTGFDDTNAKRMFIKALERVEEQNNKGYKLTDCDKNSWWEDFKAYTSCTIEQKPTGWSEKLIADVFEMVGLAKIVREQENDALTRALQSAMIELAKYSVVPQIRQEWSEEDESRIGNLCHFLEEYGNQYYGCLTLQGTISWLKSLRPQNWKPSDEQMNTK